MKPATPEPPSAPGESPPHRLEPLEPAPVHIPPRRFSTLFSTRKNKPEKPVKALKARNQERPPPRFAEIQNSLSDGNLLRIQGMVLEKPLPAAEELTAVAALFARDEQDVGLLELVRLDADPLAPTSEPPSQPEVRVLEATVKTFRGGLFRLEGQVVPRLPAGLFRIRWHNRGGELLPGEGRLRVIDPDYAGPILTSDIDQTYLNSNIHSKRGLLNLLREPVRDKHALPGMVTLFQHLQRAVPGVTLPTVFLSASPTFFAPVFAARLGLDQLSCDGLLLKPFDAVLKREILRRNVKGAIAALKDQLSYKLLSLLEQRRLYPVGAREILMGDDSEHDAITFALYRDLMARELSLEALADQLLKHGVEWYKLEPLLRSARLAVVHQGNVTPRVDVYIRRQKRRDAPGAEEPAVVWHRDSISLARALYDAGDLASEAVAAVEIAQRLDKIR